MSTKDKIIDAAVLLFNERGFVNITLRDIATSVGMSSGNLAYHFKNKDVILQEIYSRMSSELADRVSHIRLIPSFENIDYEITPFLEFQRKYCFFYLDTLEICRAYPEIAAQHRTQIEQQIAAIRAVIDYSVEKGNMIPEKVIGSYNRIARTVWMIYSFWLTQALLMGELVTPRQLATGAKLKRNHASSSQHTITEILESGSGDEEAKRSIWTLVLPYLTLKGKNNFESVALSHGLTETQRP